MRVSLQHANWIRILWSEGEVSEAQLAQLHALADVPGVNVAPLAVSLPRTTWYLPAVWDAVAALDVEDRFIELREGGQRALGGAVGLVIDRMHRASGRTPHPWQRQAVEQALDAGGLLLADQMGLGKTASAILAAEAFAVGTNRPRCIIAPGFTREVWRRELELCGAIERREDFAALQTRDPSHESYTDEAKWIFIHYDVVGFWAGRLALKSGNRRLVACILDEIHWAKNSRAARSRGAGALALTAPFRVLLSGTPMANRPAELHWPLTILYGAYSWGSYGAFRVRYCGAFHNGYGLEDGEPSNVAELRARIAGCYLRRTLADTGEAIPRLSRQRLAVGMSVQASVQHDAVMAEVNVPELVRAVVERRAGVETLSTITRLRKLVSGQKIASTVAYVQQAIDEGESVVVFCWQRVTCARIAQKLQRTAAMVHGGLPQSERDHTIAGFQATGTPMALVATYGALREGVTLHRARLVVLHDVDWVPSAMLQAEARVHRIGQTRPVISTWVTADDSLDELLLNTFAAKAALQHDSLGIEAFTDVVEELGLRTTASEWSTIVAELLREIR